MKDTHIRTISGRWVDPKALMYADSVPQNTVYLPDICTALANTCRFGGHVRHFFSVADHVYYGALLFADAVVCAAAKRETVRGRPAVPVGQTAVDDASSDGARFLYVLLRWLLHDAHEAYCGDIPAPLKRACGYHEHMSAGAEKQLQDAVQAAILNDLGLCVLWYESADAAVRQLDHQVTVVIEDAALRPDGRKFSKEIIPAPYDDAQMAERVHKRIVAGVNPGHGGRLLRAIYWVSDRLAARSTDDPTPAETYAQQYLQEFGGQTACFVDA